MNQIYVNEINKIIDLNNLYIKHLISLTLQNNQELNNQNIQQSQLNLSSQNFPSFLQRKRNLDDSNNSNFLYLNYQVANNPQFQYNEIKRGQNFLLNNNQISENNLNFLSNNINSNNEIISNNNNINKLNFFGKETNLVNNNNINTNGVILNAFNINNNSIVNKFNGVNENSFNINLSNDNFINNNGNFMPNNSFLNNINKSIYNQNNNNLKDLKEKPNKDAESSLLNNNENNNEVKVLKNHKAVYVNSYLLNSPSSSKKLKKLNKIAFIGKSKRSSRYRGVSRNGNQWQVLIMLKRGKSYVGSYTSEEFAARIYDILAIKYRGIKARTNFKYSSEQIKTILETDIDIKSKDIYDFIEKIAS